MYYLRLLLSVVRELACFKDIRCINDVQYSSFRKACYALGLLDNDKEYSDRIIEASIWSFAQSLRYLFTNSIHC